MGLGEFFFDDGFAESDLFLAALAGFGGEDLKAVDIVEVDLVDLADFGVDVAGDGDVDHEEGAVFAFAAHVFDVLGLDDVVGSAGRGDDDVDFLEGLLPVVEADGAATHLFGEEDGFVVGAVGNEHALGAAREEGLRGGTGHFAGADDHDLGILEVAEDFLGEVDGDAADRGLAFLDAGGVADFLADGEGALKEAVEDATSDASFESGGVALLDLAKDFGFAEDHGVEPADDAAEVDGGFASVLFVKVLVGGDSEAFLQVIGKGGGCFFEGVGGEIELGAVAGGDDDAFSDGVAVDEGGGFFTEVGVGNGDLFTQLDGCGFVVEAEAEEFHRG